MAYDRSTHRQTLSYTDFSSGAGAMQGFQSSQELYGLQQAAAAGMDIMGRAFFPPTVAAAAAASSPVPPPLIMSENNLLFPWPAELQNRTLLDVESSSSARFLFPAAPPCEPLSMAAPSSSSLSLSLNHALGLTNYSTDNHLLKNSKFLIPARELLNEFCNLKTAGAGGTSKPMAGKSNPHREEGRRPSTSSNPINQSALYTFNIHELQARKAKLMAMLQEVDSRYRRYREQMRALVASFEEVAGEGSAAAYSTLASKVMSRHFRCLRDGIAEQVQAMGEKDDDAVAPGTTRGETPRLKLIGRCLRQQRALRHPAVMESHPWRPQRGLPERSVAVLRAWLFEHFLHPYPSDVDKHILARQTGLSRSQVSNWFINARVRLWKPMVEEMYKEETKDKEMQTTELEENSSHNASRNLMYNDLQVVVMDEEQKPDPDSLSWVISGRDGRGSGKGFRNPSESFGVVDIDFASYGGGGGGGNGSGGLMHHGGGVSLTLGLQQHDGGRGGMSLSFSPPTTATQIFSREAHMMEEAAQHTTTTTYRNLMGAHQLLRDLAG